MPRTLLLLASLFTTLCCAAQTPASVAVDLNQKAGPFSPIYSWFGFDESNYTTSPNGQKLLGELHDLSPVPVHIRAHFLLASGNGKPELKWSSTNVYSEDASGNPVYSWTILDQIFDAYAAAHVRPLVELGFMPKDLSEHPEPYHIGWPTKPGDLEGWSYPPKDYRKWEELARQVAAHMVQRYGMENVSSWYWEVWNEPDLNYYWKGSQPEYLKLYDYAVAGVREAIPNAHVGGPATTGPGPDGSRSTEYLRAFLNHCAKEKSAANGQKIPLEFISFHVKGSPNVLNGHVQMGLDHEMSNAANGFAIVQSFPGFARLPIILTEADPEGCAACSARQYPQNAYRNGPLYPCYTAAAMKGLLELADRFHVNLLGMQTWAFEFEGAPYFEGYRSLATNGVDKPILNLFRMAGLMRGERVTVKSSSAVSLDDIMKSGVREGPDIDGLAVKDRDQATVMLWNYHDEDIEGPIAAVDLSISGVPLAARRVLVEQFRIDYNHSNAYTVWRQIGSPQNPTPEQYAKLEAAGQLELLGSPRWMTAQGGEIQLKIQLPRQAVSLLRVTWPEE